MKVLGGDYPPIESIRGDQVMLHGWFPQVSNIETANARAKANGAITVSEGGIVSYHKGGRW